MTDFFHDYDISKLLLPIEEFLGHIEQNKSESKRYCFILGAGASLSSGLPSAKDLALKWLNEMTARDMKDETLFDYVSQVNPVIKPGVRINPAKYYSYIYQKRFQLDRDEGYFAFEEVMKISERQEPHTGYRLLARILTKNPCFNIVITTNFDRLVEDAISTVGISPQVIGHEALAEFAKPLTTTPTVIKIHRDLLFHPMNSSEDIRTLSDRWEEPLKQILRHNTPIVIGYGGNDGTLMDFLQTKNISQLFWCCPNPDKLADENPRIIEAVKKSPAGRIVKIEDFDKFMQKLAKTLGIGYLPIPSKKDYEAPNDLVRPPLCSRNRDVKSLSPINLKLSFEPEESEFSNISNWSDYQIKCRLEEVKKWLNWESGKENEEVCKWWENFEKDNKPACVLKVAEQLHDKDVTITELYQSYIATGRDDIQANLRFLEFRRKMKLEEITKLSFDYQKRYYYERKIKNPKSARRYIAYANYLSKRNDYQGAQKLYEEALEKIGRDATLYWFYAVFLATNPNEKDYDKANEKYIEALKIKPNDAYLLWSYADFLEIKQSRDKAEKGYTQANKCYRRALEIKPKEAALLCAYADFLESRLNEYDNAKAQYEKAIEVEPKSEIIHGEYAIFLLDIAQDYEEAEKHFKLALEKEQENGYILFRYAFFLATKRKNFTDANKYYEKALEFKLNHEAKANDNVIYYSNYLLFLHSANKKTDLAAKFYKKATEILVQETDVRRANLARLNFCQYCIISNRKNEAKKRFDEITKTKGKGKDKNINDVMYERFIPIYNFFGYILEAEDKKRKEYKKEINVLLKEKVRSKSWYFDDLLECELIMNYNNYNEIKKTAIQINEPYKPEDETSKSKKTSKTAKKTPKTVKKAKSSTSHRKHSTRKK